MQDDCNFHCHMDFHGVFTILLHLFNHPIALHLKHYRTHFHISKQAFIQKPPRTTSITSKNNNVIFFHLLVSLAFRIPCASFSRTIISALSLPYRTCVEFSKCTRCLTSMCRCLCAQCAREWRFKSTAHTKKDARVCRRVFDRHRLTSFEREREFACRCRTGGID